MREQAEINKKALRRLLKIGRRSDWRDLSDQRFYIDFKKGMEISMPFLKSYINQQVNEIPYLNNTSKT